MKKNLNKEMKQEEEKIDKGAIGISERITNRLPKWAIYLLVVIGIGILFIILYFTDVI